MHLHLIALWTSLANAPHEHGTWRVEHRGEVFHGDWKVTFPDRVHYVSSVTGDHCLAKPRTLMSCRNARTELVHVDATAPREAMRPAGPSLAVEQLLFARIHRRGVFAALNAKGTTRDDRLRLTIPHREESAETPLEPHGFTRRVTVFETTFSIGPRPRDVAFTLTRETDTFTEKCLYPAHAASSCTPQPPDCIRL